MKSIQGMRCIFFVLCSGEQCYSLHYFEEDRNGVMDLLQVFDEIKDFTLFPTKEMVAKRDIIHVVLPAIEAERNVFQPAGNTEHEVCRSPF